MDEGPFRGSRPADRRAVSRPEPVQRQQEEPRQPVRAAEPQATERPAAQHRSGKDKKPSKRFKLPIIIAAIVLLGLVGWLLWSGTRNSSTAIDSSKYQAVFFTNGQVYFGKLSLMNDNYLKLTNIYYLQTKTATTDTNPQQTSSSQSDVQLIKLGDEIHGPEDQMVISKDQVLFYENLKPDGKVSQSIQQFKKN